jgi:hypothetical protein
MIQIIGSMEDERTFSTLAFMKTRIQNCLCEHLDMVIWMFAQLFIPLIPFFMMMPSQLGLMRKLGEVFGLDVFWLQCLWVNFSFQA